MEVATRYLPVRRSDRQILMDRSNGKGILLMKPSKARRSGCLNFEGCHL